MSSPESIPAKRRVGRPKKFHRIGPITKNEVDVVGQILKDQPAELRPAQEQALAALLTRTKGTTREIIQRARAKFADQAESYVDIHLQATAGALANADYDSALKGAQWAIQSIHEAGARVVDSQKDTSSGPKVMVGIQLGGIGPVTTPSVKVLPNE